LIYFESMQKEIRAIVPAAWRALAEPFTRSESKEFGVWRGGDVVARLTYVLVGLMIGGFMVWAPFVPIWESWFPFALAISSWWLPDAQVAYQRRRYARALGGIAQQMSQLQPRLEGMVSTEELLLPDKEGQK